MIRELNFIGLKTIPHDIRFYVKDRVRSLGYLYIYKHNLLG